MDRRFYCGAELFKKLPAGFLDWVEENLSIDIGLWMLQRIESKQFQNKIIQVAEWIKENRQVRGAEIMDIDKRDLFRYLTARRKTIEANIAKEELAGNEFKVCCEKTALAEITALEHELCFFDSTLVPGSPEWDKFHKGGTT